MLGLLVHLKDGTSYTNLHISKINAILEYWFIISPLLATGRPRGRAEIQHNLRSETTAFLIMDHAWATCVVRGAITAASLTSTVEMVPKRHLDDAILFRSHRDNLITWFPLLHFCLIFVRLWYRSKLPG